MVPTIVKENLEKLQNTDMSFKSIYTIFTDRFKNEIFAEYLKDGKVVKVSYASLNDRVEKMSKGLGKILISPENTESNDDEGNIVGIYMENSVEWVVLFWAILKSGFRPLLLNTRQDVKINEQILSELNVIKVFYKDECEAVGYLKNRFAGLFENIKKIENTENTERVCADDSDTWSDSIILVTSGSTKKPKLIVHNGKSICSQIELTSDILKRNITLRHNRKLEVRILAFLPFYHIFGLVATMMWFTFFGRTLIFMKDYSPNTIQNTCRRMDVSHFFAIPMVWETMVKKLMVEVEKQNKKNLFMKMISFSNSLQTVMPHLGPVIIRNTIFKKVRKQMLGENLHFLISGGGFISEDTLKILNGLGYSLYLGYGLTECGIVSVNLSRKAKKRLTPSCGPVFSNIKYRVNEKSELEIGLENSFIGQYIEGEFVPNTNEYYNTNDIVKINENGELFIVGRLDDVIITENGENMSPEAIEARLDSTGFKSATLVYAGADKKQLVLAVEENVSYSALKQSEAIKKLFDSFDRLQMFERPQRVVKVFGDIPYNLKGVDRRKLTSAINEERIFMQDCSVPTDEEIKKYTSETYNKVLEIARESFKEVTGTENEVSDSTDFISIGGDSMMYIELLEKISEKLGYSVEMPSSPLLTPMAFADYITDKK